MYNYQLTITDQIVIMTALSQKAEEVAKRISEYPTDKYWADKMEEIKDAYKNIAGVEMEIELV